MTNATAKLNLPTNPSSAQALARFCYECEGTTEAAAAHMRDMVLDDPELAEHFRESAYLTWAHTAVQTHVSALRREQLGPVSNDSQRVPVVSGSVPKTRSYTGHRRVAEATLYDMPMFGGKRLGDCLKTDLLNGAAESELRIASMQRTNTFARAVANAMKIASLTVEQQLSLGKLEELQAATE